MHYQPRHAVKFPKTGEQAEQRLSFLGLVVMSATSILGLLKQTKKYQGTRIK